MYHVILGRGGERMLESTTGMFPDILKIMYLKL
jgi:hypothetical protein